MRLPIERLLDKLISVLPDVVVAITSAARRPRSAPPPAPRHGPPIDYGDPHCWSGVSWAPGAARTAQHCLFCKVQRSPQAEATHCPGVVASPS